MVMFTQSGLDRGIAPVVTSESPSGPDCVNNSFGRREGFSVGEQPWFKHWGKESIASGDLNSLTDHEERVFWRLLAVGCVEHERWHIRIPHEALARMCASTPSKLTQCIWTFEKRGMLVVEDDGALFLCNADRYQETPEAKRQRRKRERDATVTSNVTSHGAVTPNVTGEERGKRKELIPNGINPAPRRGRPRKSPTPERADEFPEEWLTEFQAKHPTVDVRAILARKRNRETWAGYLDRRQALRVAVEFQEQKVQSAFGNGASPTQSATSYDDPDYAGNMYPDLRRADA